MQARARAVLEAGCDVALHCSGRFAEMQAVASAAPELCGEAARRFRSARARLRPAQAFDEPRAEALLAEVLGEIA
jgi:beta-N-acetylhexosaminidase